MHVENRLNKKGGERLICGDDLRWVSVEEDILDSFGVVFRQYNLERLIIISRTDGSQLELALRHIFSCSFGLIIVISLYFVE
jgi:hypothetical protein